MDEVLNVQNSYNNNFNSLKSVQDKEKGTPNTSSKKKTAKRNSLNIQKIIQAKETQSLIKNAHVDLNINDSGVLEKNIVGIPKDIKNSDTLSKKRARRKKKRKTPSQIQDGASYSSADLAEDDSSSVLSLISKHSDNKSKNSDNKSKNSENTDSVIRPSRRSRAKSRASSKNSDKSQPEIKKSSILNEQPLIPDTNFDIPAPKANYRPRAIDIEPERSISRASIRSSSSTHSEISLESTDGQKVSYDGTQIRSRPRKVIKKPETGEPPLKKILADESRYKTPPREPVQPRIDVPRQFHSPPRGESPLARPSPPKEGPPARRSRGAMFESLSSSASTITTDELQQESGIKVHRPRANPYLMSSTLSSEATTTDEEGRRPPRPRRSPLRISAPKKHEDIPRSPLESPPPLEVQTPVDEKAVETSESSSSEVPKEGSLRAKQYARHGPLFNDSADRSNRTKERPPPLVVEEKAPSKESRKINEALENRNAKKPRESFVVAAAGGVKRAGQAYTPPPWEITVQKVDTPADAKYVHQLQTTFSMSSILNGLKREQ